MKKAYLIMAHKYPSHLYRLVARLNDNQSHFFIHIDKNVNITEFDSLKDFGSKLSFIERFDSRWGKYGITLPLLEGLKQIKNLSEKPERIIILSGQDYPIKSNQEINLFFSDSRYSVFMSHFPIPNFSKWPGSDRGGLYRFDKYYFGEKWIERLGSKTLNFLATYIKGLKRKMPNNMVPYAGSAWMILDMYALDHILNYVALHPEYLEFHKHTFVADEVFIHTVLANSYDADLEARMQNVDKHYIVWESDQSPHPTILQKSHFDAIKQSEHLFARKFDEQIDSAILELIDKKILFK